MALLDVLHFLHQAWDSVKNKTICNCFQKVSTFQLQKQIVKLIFIQAGFISTSLELGDGDLQEECAFARKIKSTCNWDEYVAIDESLDCFGTLTTKEITSALLNEQTEEYT